MDGPMDRHTDGQIDLLQVPPVNMGMVSNSILWKSRATGLYSSWFLSRKL